MYDAIIVGARCAGSPLAMLLARQGHRVLLMDRDTFPSDTLSTAFLQPDAMRRLDEWGILEKLKAAGTPAVDRLFFSALGMRIERPPMGYPGMAPRRTVLDKLLVDAAREAGVEVREGFSCQDLVRDGTGAVAGVIGQDREGNQVMEEARIVVGADGRNSFVARQVEAEEYDVHQPSSCGFYSVYSNVPMDLAEIHMTARHFMFYFPTNGGCAYIGAEAPLERWDEYRKDPEAYLKTLFEAHAPTLAGYLANGKREERMLGMTGRKSMLRKPYGPGWALAGDAGYLKDPVLGTGVDDAFRDAELLAEALEAGFSGKEPMDAALAAYHARRDAAIKDIYPLICKFAEMGEVTPEMVGGFAMAQAAQAG